MTEKMESAKDHLEIDHILYIDNQVFKKKI